MSNPKIPIPADLGGFQNVVYGRVQAGDLIIPSGGQLADAVWANSLIGAEIVETSDGQTLADYAPVRIYRRMPVPHHCDDKSAVTTSVADGNDTVPNPGVAVLGLHDSGQRRSATTGALRDRAVGKGRYDLLPVIAIARFAKHLEKGASKYSARNWEKGMPLSWYIDSAIRHCFEHLAGLRDEDHLSAAMFNVCGLLWTSEQINAGLLPKELDDLPPVATGALEEMLLKAFAK